MNIIVGEDGEKYVEAADGSYHLMTPQTTPEQEITVPEENGMPYGMKPEHLATANQAIKIKNAYKKSLVGDERKLALDKLASEMGPLAAIGGGMHRTGDKLASGTMDLVDRFRTLLPGDDTELNQSIVDRASEQSVKDQEYQYIQQNNPLSSLLGEAAPFLATGFAGKPVAGMVDKVLGSTVKNNMLSPLMKGIHKLDNAVIKKSPTLNKLTQKTRTNIRHNRNSYKPDLQEYNSVKDLREMAMVGSAEGAAHYDMSALEGAGYSALGQLTSAMSPVRKVEQLKNRHEPYHKEVLEKAYSEGLHLTPGERMLNVKAQMNEAAMRNARGTTDLWDAYDVANNKYTTKKFADAIGIKKTDGSTSLSPGELNAHTKDLKGSLDALQNSTTGRFVASDSGPIRTRLDRLKTRTNATDVETHKVLSDFADEMKQMATAQRDPVTGRMTAWTYDGSKYQNMYSRIKAKLNESYQPGSLNAELSGGLQEMIKALDDSIQRGMTHGGSSTAKQWNKERERYALTKLGTESGLDIDGMVNLDKLGSKLMDSREANRSLTRSGGKITELQELAVANSLLKKNRKTDPVGVEFDPENSSSRIQGINQMPLSDRLTPTPMRRAFTKMYMQGYPLTKGLPHKTAANVNRATTMAGGPLELLDRGGQSFSSMFTGDGEAGYSFKDKLAELMGVSKKKDLKSFEELIKSLEE